MTITESVLPSRIAANGWSYDPMMVVINLVIVTTDGGNLGLGCLFK